MAVLKVSNACIQVKCVTKIRGPKTNKIQQPRKNLTHQMFPFSRCYVNQLMVLLNILLGKLVVISRLSQTTLSDDTGKKQETTNHQNQATDD